PGDVVAYSAWDGFHHATLYLGGRMIAMHTSANHPDGIASNFRTDEAGQNNWEASAHASHPSVTLIHFTYRDLDTRRFTWVHGWWKMIGVAALYHYYFSPDGRVLYTNKPPVGLTAAPARADGVGYWFMGPQGEMILCWRDTGTLERLRQVPGKP